MEKLPAVDQEYLKEVLITLLKIPSPTGYTDRVCEHLRNEMSEFPLKTKITNKGSLVAVWEEGETDISQGVTAHMDTLGALVKEIKSNGRLRITQLGGYPWNTIEGEGCSVLNNEGKIIRGSILIDYASHHIYGDKVSERVRDNSNLEVRLDIDSFSEEQTKEFGVEVGSFVFLDSRVEETNDFIRSRYLDDKAGVACVLAAIQSLDHAGLAPCGGALFHFSNYEEVGHGGASGIPNELTELLTIDMAAVGEGQNSDEYHSTLCVKDSRGPYHYRLGQKLQRLAQQYEIPHKIDVYPHYGSDGEAYWRAGGDAAVALIGPGVDASHNYERTHMRSLTATTQWILAFLLSE
jgi:putative aminopeptidase FrvX